MPEGDTIYKIAAFMRPRIVGRVIERAALLRQPAPELVRREVIGVDVHGKHLLILLGPKGPTGWCLRVHLGMWGSWHSYPPGAAWKKPAYLASVVLDFGRHHTFVCFRAEQADLYRPRTPLAGDLGAGRQRLRQVGAQLIADPLPSAAASPGAPTTLPQARPPSAGQSLHDPAWQAIWHALDRTAKSAPMVDVLLNQRIAAGIGNVYKSELLFLAKVYPLAPLGALSAWTVASLFLRGKALLEQNLGGWPRTTTRDLRSHALPRGLPRLWVYNRAHKPCLLCGTSIAKALNGRHERVTYWCPTCQPAAAVGLSAACWVVERHDRVRPRARPRPAD